MADTALLPRSYAYWPSEGYALLDQKQHKFATNIVNIINWRSTPLYVITPSFIIGSSIIDVFICTSTEYLYSLRVEYFLQNTGSCVLSELISPITKELIQTVRFKVPFNFNNSFYMFDQPRLTLQVTVNSAIGINLPEGDLIATPLFFSYTPSLPFVFNLATVYIPTGLK